MRRAIEGANLRCGHPRPGAPGLSLDGEVDCERCDRFEMPESFVAYKRTAELDEHTVPAGLRADHSTKRGVWGLLHVVSGQLTYIVEPPLARELLVTPERPAVIVAEVKHRVRPDGPVRFFVEFWHQPASH
jgi:tellurite resistance-related uncharacterized protein